MTKNLAKGIKLLSERVGESKPAQAGDTVVYNLRLFLSGGDEVSRDAQLLLERPTLASRQIDGQLLIDHTLLLGRRRVIAGIEKTIIGMQAGGFREVLISPHLAYAGLGVDGLIPPDALLRAKIWLQVIN